MYAVVQTGGKQYRVTEGDVICVEKLAAEAGQTVVLDEVLAVGEGSDLKLGAPFVEGAAVNAEVLENGKAEKVIIFKYKAKKDYRRKKGHRQPFTKLQIKAIVAEGAKKAAKAEKPAEAEAPAPKAEPARKVNLKSMKKAELIDFAKENNIEINAKATNADMIAAIEAALK